MKIVFKMQSKDIIISQREYQKLLEVWCIIAQDGSISTAHCTCMAGSSEVCMRPSTSLKISLKPVSEMPPSDMLKKMEGLRHNAAVMRIVELENVAISFQYI